MFIDIFGKKIYYEMYGAEHMDTLLYFMGDRGQAVWILSTKQRH